MKKNKRTLFKEYSLVLFSLLSFILVTYKNTIHIYFQQDEWYGFGQAIYSFHHGYEKLLGIQGTFHLTPFSNFIYTQVYRLFEYDSAKYAIISLCLHFISSLLLYILAKRVLKNKNFALLAAIFFSIFNAPQQAVTWYASFLNTIPSAIFGILSLIFFEGFIKSKKNSHYFYLSLVLLIIGLGFKEDIFSLFLFYSALLFAKFGFKNTKTLITITGIFAYSLLRLLLQFANPLINNPSVYQGEFLSRSMNFVNVLLKGFSQLFFSQSLLQQISIKISLSSSDKIYGTISIALSLLLIFALIVIALKSTVITRKRLIVFAGFIFCAFVPYGFLPPHAVLASRHMYFPAIGGAILLSYTLLLLSRHSSKNIFISSGVIIFVAFYLLMNIKYTHRQIAYQTNIGNPRRFLVDQLAKTYNNPAAKTVVYQTGDSLNLQISPAYMIAVLFHEKHDYTHLLLGEKLWSMSEGYMEFDNVGIGFFTNYDSLMKTYGSKDLEPNNIISFHWDAKSSRLTDTTSEIRSQLK